MRAPLKVSFFLTIFISFSQCQIETRKHLKYKEKWGYVTVRKDAHMFWWLYFKKSSRENRPLILWLQGGPGSSSTGYGNFRLFGPLDINSTFRDSTWLQKADLLFVDNPVGAGFSYVENDAFTTNIQEIAQDLTSLAKDWFNKNKSYQKRPFYIMGESYGGKMAAAFAKELNEAIKKKTIKANLQGVVFGDSWISPIDYVTTWGPYLYATSHLDTPGLERINQKTEECKQLVKEEKWYEATACWNAAEWDIIAETSSVSFYNILKQMDQDPYSMMTHGRAKDVGSVFDEQLNNFMNGPIRKKLGIIPESVKFAAQSNDVFRQQKGDFMKPVIEIADHLLNNTDVRVIIYNGQLDLICDTMGTELWVSRLKWPKLQKWQNAERAPFRADMGPDKTHVQGYLKKYENFEFFWFLRAGHMVPHDNPYGALKMLDMIFESS